MCERLAWAERLPESCWHLALHVLIELPGAGASALTGGPAAWLHLIVCLGFLLTACRSGGGEPERRRGQRRAALAPPDGGTGETA